MRSRLICILLIACSAALVLAVASAAQSGRGKAEAKKPEAAKTAPASAAKGKALFQQWCEICHFTETTEKKVGPGLKGLYKRGKFASGRKVDDASLRTWIEKGGKDMPAFGGSLNKDEIRDLIAYLKTL